MQLNEPVQVPPAPLSAEKKIFQIKWDKTDAYCGDKVSLNGETQGYEGQELTISVQEQANSKEIASIKVKAGIKGFLAEWEFKDLLPEKSGDKYVAQKDLIAKVEGVQTATPLKAHFVPDAAKRPYRQGGAHFDLAAEAYVAKITSDLEYVQGWGASVVDLGAEVPAATGGTIAGLSWTGYRWMKKVGLKDKYWDGKGWVDLPGTFVLEDSNNFCVGFYKQGTAYKCQYGGEWPEAFADWSLDSGPNAAKLAKWKDNIKTTWDTKNHNIAIRRDGCASGAKECCRYAVQADVEFVDKKAFSNGVLIIADGDIRSNDSLFFIDEPRIAMAAHEFGHHLGNPDEYAEAKASLDPTLNDDGAKNGVDKDSIMGQNMTKVKKRHFRTICKHFGDVVFAAVKRQFTYKPVDL